MCTEDNVFALICLKANHGRDGVTNERKGEHSIKWWRGGGGVESPSRSLPQLQILIPHKKHPEECAWSDHCNNFGSIEREISFKATSSM